MKDQGGFHIGDLTYSNGETYGIIVSDRSGGLIGKWTSRPIHVPTSLEDGYLNTIMMNSINNNSNIAKYILTREFQGFNDWFIPSKKELEFIFLNRSSLPFAFRFSNDSYWTSTEVEITKISAYLVDFYETKLDTKWSSKRKECYVRPIRKFKI